MRPRYDYRRAGLVLTPSVEGLKSFGKLDKDTRAELLSEAGLLIRIKRDGVRTAERWARAFWIPLNEKW